MACLNLFINVLKLITIYNILIYFFTNVFHLQKVQITFILCTHKFTF